MNDPLAYSVFKTHWGFFGLLGDETALRRSCLPLPEKNTVISHLIEDFDQKSKSSNIFSNYQQLICAYFDGQPADFSYIPVCLSQFSPFQQSILHTLQSLNYGKIISYTEIAALSHHPKAVRAVANTIAQNPLPLIIPCHRILRKDGSLGGFSAPGGTETKKRLLHLENPSLFP